MHVCPVDCVPGSFGGWSTCTKSCADGSQQRSRSNTAPKYGGKACPHTDEAAAAAAAVAAAAAAVAAAAAAAEEQCLADEAAAAEEQRLADAPCR